MKNSSRLPIFLAALLWPVVVLVLYYTTHKPVTPQSALDLGLLIWRITTAAGLVCLAGGIGLRAAPLPGLDPLTRLAIQAAFGLGVLALGVLLVGSTLGIPAWLFWLALAVLAILTRKNIPPWLRQWGQLKTIWQDSDRFGRTAAALLAALLFSSLVVALAPPIKFDALLYHLTMPEAYLRLGRIAHLPWIVMSGHPQTSEMLYTWAIALGSRPAATTLGWSFALLVAVGLLGYLRQLLGTRAAWAATAALFAGYTLAVATAWGYVDWLGLTFGLGCLVSLDRWRQEARRSDLLLAGAFAGLALSTKYTAGVLGLAAGITLTWHCWKCRRQFLPTIIQFGLAAAFFVTPWLVKNTFFTGNPVYPFFIPAAEMDPVRIAIYQGMPPQGNWMDFFLLPLRATVLGVDGGQGYSVAVGPLLLGLGALAWIGRSQLEAQQRGSLGNAALLAVAGMLIWAAGNRFSGYLIQTRMYFSLFPAFAALAGFGFAAASRINYASVRLGRILQAIILLVLALNVFEAGLHTLKTGAPQAALGLRSEQDYLADNLGWFQPAMQAVHDLPEGSQVLLIYEPRSLYCAPACLPDEILDRWIRDRTRLQDFDSILKNWTAQGFTHLLVYRYGVEFLKENDDPHHPLEDLLALDQFLARLPAPLDLGEVYELYEITPRR